MKIVAEHQIYFGTGLNVSIATSIENLRVPKAGMQCLVRFVIIVLLLFNQIVKKKIHMMPRSSKCKAAITLPEALKIVHSRPNFEIRGYFFIVSMI